MAYVDIVVLVILALIVIIYSKRFQTYIFGFGTIDILFRILNIINSYIPVKEIKILIKTYIPESVPHVINNYTKGMVNTALTLAYVIIMGIFLYYVIKIFVKRKKI